MCYNGVMIIRLTNEQGAISFNGILIDQIIAGAMKPWSGRVFLAQYRGRQSDKAVRSGSFESLDHRIVRTTERGVFIRLYVMMRFGTSISAASRDIIEKIASDIRSCLDVPIDDIEVVVTGLISEKVAPRSISVSLSELERGQRPSW